MLDFLRTGVLGAAALTLAVGAADAATYSFTLSQDGGNGSVVDLGFGAFEYAFTLTGSDGPAIGGVLTSYTSQTAANETAKVSFEWQYSTQDINGSFFDQFGYIIGETLYQLSTNGIAAPAFQNGSLSFFVPAATTFGWYIFATDNILGAADADVFANIETSPIPLPAAGFLLIGALGGLAAVRRRKAA